MAGHCSRKMSLSFLWSALLLLATCRVTNAVRFLSKDKLGFQGDDTLGVLQLGRPDEPPLENPRPLIGILSQPGDGEGHEVINGQKEKTGEEFNTSYIAASYVKFVEMGGARAVPILFDSSFEELDKVFRQINGLLLPGGGADTHLNSTFMETAHYLVKKAIAANDAGDYFPIHGTCLGFEMLAILIAEDDGILEPFKAPNRPSVLTFVSNAAKHHGLFRFMSGALKEKVQEQQLAMENHEWGLSPGRFTANNALGSFFRILTTSPDDNSMTYVSTVMGYKHPFYGTQWHPEKNAFEWAGTAIPHNQDAVLLTQAVANHLVSEARKSQHAPESLEEEQRLLIYNYDPVYTGKTKKGYFDQAYIFELPDSAARR